MIDILLLKNRIIGLAMQGKLSIYDEKDTSKKNIIQYLKNENSIALSKNDFANLVCNDEEYSKGFDYSVFNNIFDVIRQILEE